MYSSRSLQICPLINRSLIGKSVLADTSGAGAPFPHCGAAHGASGGPRAGPEARARGESRGKCESRQPARSCRPPHRMAHARSKSSGLWWTEVT